MKERIEEMQNHINGLQAELDELKKGEPSYLEVGKWYTEDGTNKLLCITEVTGGHMCRAYGFDINGVWRDNDLRLLSGFKLASHEKVKEALIKEAKKRGYKSGIRCISVMDGEEYDCIEDTLGQNRQIKYSDGYLIGNCTIFHNGEWAKIVKNSVYVNGHKMKVQGDIVSFGCQGYNRNNIIEVGLNIKGFNENPVNNSGIQSIKMNDRTEVEVSKLIKITNILNK